MEERKAVAAKLEENKTADKSKKRKYEAIIEELSIEKHEYILINDIENVETSADDADKSFPMNNVNEPATGAIEDIVNSKETDHVPIETKVDVISIETVSSDSVPGSEIVKQDEEVIDQLSIQPNSTQLSEE